jgi:hypothetical protein
MQHVMVVDPQAVIEEDHRQGNDGDHLVAQPRLHHRAMRRLVRERTEIDQSETREEAAGDLAGKELEEQHPGDAEGVKHHVDRKRLVSLEGIGARKRRDPRMQFGARRRLRAASRLYCGRGQDVGHLVSQIEETLRKRTRSGGGFLTKYLP